MKNVIFAILLTAAPTTTTADPHIRDIDISNLLSDCEVYTDTDSCRADARTLYEHQQVLRKAAGTPEALSAYEQYVSTLIEFSSKYMFCIF